MSSPTANLIDLNALPLDAVFAHLVDETSLQLFDLAWREDLGDAGDVTTNSLIDVEHRGTARLGARESGVVAGLILVPTLIGQLGLDLVFDAHTTDGATCAAGEQLGAVTGSLRDLLAFERLLLNTVGRLSGIATTTRKYVDAVGDRGVDVCETRKTTPGWRGLEKYAVRCGGGTLHRTGLHDAALYKDNHLAHLPGDLGTSLAPAIRRVREDHALRFVEVEVDNLDQLQSLLNMDPVLIDIILLDNMSLVDMTEAVALRDRASGTIRLEASGDVTLERLPGIVGTGVDRVSIGALTHSFSCLNIGLDITADAGA